VPSIHALIANYGYVGVTCILCLEMIGIPFPAETTLTVTGFAWSQGDFHFIPLLLSAVIGNLIGSTVAYWIGAWLGRPVVLRFGRYIGLTEARLNAAERKFQGYETIVVLIAKFIAGVRVAIPYLAGINRMSFALFTMVNTIGAILWAAVFILAGRYAGEAWARYHTYLHGWMWWVGGTILLLIVAGYAALHRRHGSN
jgi:membrane protein DedA with SNARE-associated domain